VVAFVEVGGRRRSGRGERLDVIEERWRYMGPFVVLHLLQSYQKSSTPVKAVRCGCLIPSRLTGSSATVTIKEDGNRTEYAGSIDQRRVVVASYGGTIFQMATCALNVHG
jgi:hypothetical protein